MAHDDLLEDLGAEIVRRFGDAVRVERHEDMLLVHGVRCGGVVGISVDDASRPSFGVSYPGFDHDASSWRELRERTATGVLLVGVLSIVRDVAREGAVLPEFAHEALRRSARRTPHA